MRVMDEAPSKRATKTRLFEDVATQRLRVLNPRTHRFGEANRITGEQIQALQFYDRSPLFDEKEKARFCTPSASRAARLRFARYARRVAKFYDEGQIVELTLVICAPISPNPLTTHYATSLTSASKNVAHTGLRQRPVFR